MDTVIMGEAPGYIQDYFLKNNYNVITADNNTINRSLANHVDLVCSKITEQTFIVEKRQERIIKHLKEKGSIVKTEFIPDDSEYPVDCRINFAVFGKLVFGNSKAMSESIMNMLEESGLKFIHENQGYTKCSTLVLNNNAAITDDKSVFNKIKENNIECILINKGDIKLEGFEYGFIGGASCVDKKRNKVIFFGDLFLHRDSSIIIDFIRKNNMNFEYIPGKPLTDIGGAIII